MPSPGRVLGPAATEPADSLFFLHVPKSGGTTFFTFLAQHYPTDAIFDARHYAMVDERTRAPRPGQPRPVRDVSRWVPELAAEMSNYRLCIENHASFEVFRALRAVQGSFKCVTVLREPRRRIASMYNHHRRTDVDAFPELDEATRTGIRLTRELSLPEMVRQNPDLFFLEEQFDNRQVAQIGGGEVYATVDRRTLEAALENLETIDFVGISEDLDSLMQLLAAELGWLPPATVQQLNRRDSVEAVLAHNSAIDLAEIPDAWVRYDDELYAAARQRAESQSLRARLRTAKLAWNSARRDQRIIAPRRALFTMDDALPGSGWHTREGVVGESVRWIGPRPSANIYLGMFPGRRLEIRIFIVAMMSPEVFDSTTYRFNGTELRPELSIVDNMTVATLRVPGAVNSAELGNLEITSASTASAFDLFGVDDKRQKTIAIRQIELLYA